MLLIMKNLHRQEDFSFTVVKENRKNPLPETKIVLNYYLIIMSEILTTVPKCHSSWIPKMNLNDKKRLQWPFSPYSLKLTFPNSTLLISSEQAKLGVKCTPLQVSVDAPDHFFLVYIVPILTLIGIYTYRILKFWSPCVSNETQNGQSSLTNQISWQNVDSSEKAQKLLRTRAIQR